MAETNKITLTLEPKKEETPVVEEEKIVVPIEISDKDLTEEEKKMVEEFSKTIDITSNNIILTYGAEAQKKKVLSFINLNFIFVKDTFL